MTVSPGDPLTLKGQSVDVGLLNFYYNITIELSAGIIVKCILINVTKEAIICQPYIGNAILDVKPKRVMVSCLNFLVRSDVGSLLTGTFIGFFMAVHSSKCVAFNLTPYACHLQLK